MTNTSTVDIAPLLKARDVFEQFRMQLETDQEKAGAVQAFEFCYELAWKAARRVLMNKGVEVNSPRDVFRAAGANKLIDDPEVWFHFIKIRNLTVHTYNYESLEEVVASFDSFSKSLDQLIMRLKQNI